MTNNTITQEHIQVGEIANGLPLTIPVYRIKGQADAKSAYIQANMHGAEVQGNAVIFQLLEQLKDLDIRGDITLVPYANPIGCNQKSGEFTLGRFDPITGANWNRMYHFDANLVHDFAAEFKDHSESEIKAAFKQRLQHNVDALLQGPDYRLTTGKRLALNLQRLAHQADIVLDLHTGPISTEHLYCPEYARASARHFNIANVLLIPNEFDGAMDEAAFCPWWQLQQTFEQLHQRTIDIPVEAFTVELGSQERIDLEQAQEQAQSILSYLTYQEVICSPIKAKQMTRYGCMLKDYVPYYAPMGGMVQYLAPLGEPIKAGEPIAKILRMERYLSESPLTTLTFDHDAIPILHFASASVNQGTELYKFFINTFEL